MTTTLATNQTCPAGNHTAGVSLNDFVPKRSFLSAVAEAFAIVDRMYTPRNVEMLRSEEAITPRDAYGHWNVPKAAALAWLEKTHGAKLGDVVSVAGWVKPRDILIEDFSIHEDREGYWFMWFTGPTAYPKCTERRSNGTPGYSSVYRVSSSPRIERFLSWEKADLASRPPAPPAPPPAPAPTPPAPPEEVYPEAQRKDILARVLAAEQAGDHELQDRISLEWLEAVHGVRPGDYVRVPLYGGGSRVMYLTGARHCGLDKPAGHAQLMLLQGPWICMGKASHNQVSVHLTDTVSKVEDGDVPEDLRKLVRKSRAAGVVAVREKVAV